MLRITLATLMCTAMLGSSQALAQTRTVRVIAFSQGFAFPELFGTSGTEKTALLKQFEAREKINVVIEWGDEASVRQKVLADLLSGQGRYDVVLLGSDGSVQTYGYSNFLEPLDSYFKSNKLSAYLDLKQIYPSFLKANTINGNLYGLPYYSFGPGIIYRKDLFAKYGVQVPKTMPELFAALEKLKQGFAKDGVKDIYPLTMRGAPGEEPSLDVLGFVYAYAGKPAWFTNNAVTPTQIRATKARPAFTGDFKKGFAAYVDLARKYGPPGIATHTWVDMMNLYAQGKAAVLLPSAINGYAAITSSKDANVMKNSEFAPMVTGPSGKMVQSFWTFSMGVPKSSKNKNEAVKVLAFLTGKRSMQAFADRTQWPAVTMPSVMKSPVLVKRWGEAEVALNEQAVMKSDPNYFPSIPELSEFMDRIGTAASRAISTGKTDDALNELQSWALERMNNAGYYR